MNIKYLMFDIDGTLINSGGAGKKALISAFKEVLGDGRLVHNYTFAGKTDIQIFEDIAMLAGVEKKRLEGIVADIKKSYVVNLKKTLKETETYRVYSYVRDVLDVCCGRSDLEIALLTGNIDKGAKLKLEHGDLWKYFGWGVFGDISNNRVHLAEEAYKIISEKNSHIHPEDIVIIGDTANDVRCGRAINATTVGIVSEFEPEEKIRQQNPDFLIHSFNDLHKIFHL